VALGAVRIRARDDGSDHAVVHADTHVARPTLRQQRVLKE
jgi:hypothetical protein